MVKIVETPNRSTDSTCSYAMLAIWWHTENFYSEYNIVPLVANGIGTGTGANEMMN